MEISKMTVNRYGENSYILWNKDTRNAIVVDPGMSNAHELQTLDDFLRENKLNIQYVLLTHQHADHVLGVNHVAKHYNAKVAAHAADNELGQALRMQAQMLGLPDDCEPFVVTDELKDGDELSLDGEVIKVLHVPGHTPGGVALYIPEEGCVLVGDSLFQQSVGRTDLPGGSHEQLINAIKEKLLTLPAETVAYPGHGPATTIGDEKMYNPFLK